MNQYGIIVPTEMIDIFSALHYRLMSSNIELTEDEQKMFENILESQITLARETNQPVH